AREAHRLLYEYLKRAAPELPETLVEIAPLFDAVVHGCKARLFSEALVSVYQTRIDRRERIFAVKELGAVGATLTALSAFFAEPWSKVEPSLNEEETSFVLGSAGFLLRATGDLG